MDRAGSAPNNFCERAGSSGLLKGTGPVSPAFLLWINGGPINAVPRLPLPYRPDGFDQHRGARVALAHLAGPQPKPAIQASAPPPPKVEGPSAALSPVYPRKTETVEPAGQTQPQAGQARQAQVQPQTKPQPETTGMAPRAENLMPSPAGPTTRAEVQQTSAAPPESSVSNNRCDIQACASTY